MRDLRPRIAPLDGAWRRPSAPCGLRLAGGRRRIVASDVVLFHGANRRATKIRSSPMADELSIKVNGGTWPVDSDPDTPLLYVLSNELALHGPKFGCGLAQCGACSVLADGVEIRSCVTPVANVMGKSITTLEGLAAWHAEQTKVTPPPALHPLQQAFIDTQAPHC